MILAIVRAELALLAQKREMRWLLIVLACLLLGAGVITARRNAATAEAFARVSHAERARWLGQSAKNPHRAAHFGLWAFRAPSPLSAIDPGTDPYVGRMIRIEAHHPNDPLFREALAGGPLQRPKAATMTDLIALLVPLIAVLTGFASIAGDRESARLGLLIGAGCNIVTLCRARFMAAFIMLSGAVTVPLALVGGVMVTDWSDIAALAMLVLGASVYAALFLAAAMAVSLYARTSRTALAVLLAFWAMECVIVPRLATATVEHARPTPSENAMLAQIKAINDAYNTPAAAAARKQRLQDALRRTGQAARIDPGGALLYQRDHHDTAVYDRAMTTFSAQLRGQDRLLIIAAILTPALAYQQVSDALAASGAEAHLHFLSGAERYRRSMSDLMNLALRRHPPAKGMSYVAGADTFRSLPAFSLQPKTLGDLLAESLVPAACLVVALAAALLAMTIAARRARP